MNIPSLVILLVLWVTWASAELALGGLSEEHRPPFEKDDQLQQILPLVSQEIRAQVATKLANDTDVQNAVKDAPIQVLTYKTQVVSGINYFINARIAIKLYKIRINQPVNGQPTLLEVSGPLFNHSVPPSLHLQQEIKTA